MATYICSGILLCPPIINTRANPLTDRPDWGDITVNKTGDTLYLHVLEWPQAGALVLNGIDSNVTSATYLATGTEAKYVQPGDTVTFTLSSEPANQYDSVIKLKLNNMMTK
jgi:alpha-L-fucosidase